MSDNPDYPEEFKNVIAELDALSNSESRIYNRVTQFKSNLITSLDDLKRISLNILVINDIIKKLKASLSELKEQNETLEQKLAEGRTEFDNQISELKQRQNNEFEEKKKLLEKEIEELKKSIERNAAISNEEKDSAIRKVEEDANERFRQQKESIEKAHEEERTRLVSRYQNDYNGLLQALTRIAENQALAINQIDVELQQSEELTVEFSNVQKQILGLLDSISRIITNEPQRQSQNSPQEVIGGRKTIRHRHKVHLKTRGRKNGKKKDKKIGNKSRNIYKRSK